MTCTLASGWIFINIEPIISIFFIIVAPCILKFIYTLQLMHVYMILKTFKICIETLQTSNMIRSYDHPQGAHFSPC